MSWCNKNWNLEHRPLRIKSLS